MSRFCRLFFLLLFTLACVDCVSIFRLKQPSQQLHEQPKLAAKKTQEKQTFESAARASAPEAKPNEASKGEHEEAEGQGQAEPNEDPAAGHKPENRRNGRPEHITRLTEGAETEVTEGKKDAKQKDKVLRLQDSQAQERLRNLIELMKKHKAVKDEITEAEKQMASAEQELMLDITGLIIEETMTKIGYDFYEYFFLLWEEPGGVTVKEYNIYISEKASPMWGSWIQVRVDERVVWNSMLRPRSTEIEDAAKDAIQATKQYLMNFEQYQFKTNDMAGTGI